MFFSKRNIMNMLSLLVTMLLVAMTTGSNLPTKPAVFSNLPTLPPLPSANHKLQSIQQNKDRIRHSLGNYVRNWINGSSPTTFSDVGRVFYGLLIASLIAYLAVSTMMIGVNYLGVQMRSQHARHQDIWSQLETAGGHFVPLLLERLEQLYGDE